MSKKAPRAALKLHMKKNTNIRIGKNAELMAQLNILVVLHRLAEESRVKAFEEKSATIKVHHIRAVAKKTVKEHTRMTGAPHPTPLLFNSVHPVT